MKAITTGFAITALALAVSGQAAAADTESTWTFEGEVNVNSVLINNEQGAAGTADDTYPVVFGRGMTTDSDLTASIAVTNGGFSGTIDIEAGTDASVVTTSAAGVDGIFGTADDVFTSTVTGGGAEVSISDLMYEEGAISFGEIGGITTTAGYIADMDENLDYTYDEGQAFRYDAGALKVQAEGGIAYEDADDDEAVLARVDMGLAVAYTQETDAMTLTADLQYAENGASADDEALAMYYGVGATFNVSDTVVAKAAYASGQNYTTDEVADFIAGESDTATSMAVRADYTTDAMTAYGSFVSNSADATDTIYFGGTFSSGAATASLEYVLDDTMIVGVTYAGEADALTYNASFEYEMPEVGDSTMEYGADATYAVSDMISAYGSYLSRHEDAVDGVTTETTAGVSYTTEGGAVIALDYEVDTGTSTDDDDDDYTFDAIVASATYSF